MGISAVILYNDNKVSIYSEEVKHVGKSFKKGIYKCHRDTNGNIHINKIELIEVHNPYNSKDNKMILRTVNAFFKKGVRERVNAFGYIHKLGILLYGKQGCGKTSMMNYIVEKLIAEKQAIVFYCDTENELLTSIVIGKEIRKIQENPIIFVADEFDKYCYESESELKQFLDGKDSIDNSLFLGATNYLNTVPETLKNRPSRFKIVHEMKGIQNKEQVKNILRDISNRATPNLLSEEKIEEISNMLHEPTIDEIKQVCIDHITENFIPKAMSKSIIGFKQPTVEEIKEDNEEDDDLDGIYKALNRVNRKLSQESSHSDAQALIPIRIEMDDLE